MKSVKLASAPKRGRSLRTLLNPSVVPVRRVNRDKLNRLAGSWPKAEADRIATFINENCEATHEGD